MKVLVVYATGEGQTRKIAGTVASHLQELGHEVTCRDSSENLGNLDFNAFEAIFVAGSVHEQKHQETIADFVIARRALLERAPSAFLSVSLAAAMKDGMPEARSYIADFIAETGWQPADTLPVAGALRYSEYDYFRQQVVRDVIFKNDFRIDAERDYEFTDWEGVKSFAGNFVAKAGR
jgi:menaquinone-dependent protoporphyrinogen oxidase